MKSRFSMVALAAAVFSLTLVTAGAQVIAARFDQVANTAPFTTGVSLSWANDIAEIGDVDGDGIRDFAVADCAFHGSQTVLSLLNIGAVRVFSGVGTPAPLLYSIFGTQAVGYFGFTVTAIDDVDGDTVQDFVVGIPGGGSIAGSAQVRSGINGALITPIASPFATSAFFGLAVGVGPDYDGDGLRDIAIGSIDSLGQTSSIGIFSTSTGGLIGSFTSGTVSSGIFTHPGAIVFVDDVDGDGIRDIALGEPNLDQVEVVSGNLATLGVNILTFNAAVGGNGFGRAVSTEVDLDGDLAREIVVGEPGLNSYHVFGTTSGALIGTRTAATGANLGMSLSTRTMPGLTRILAGAPNAVVGLAAIESDKVNNVEWRLAAPTAPTAAPGFGSRVLGCSDRNGDGHGEIAICAGRAFSGGTTGNAWVIFGAGPATVFNIGTGTGALNILASSGALMPDPNHTLTYVTSAPNVGGIAALFMGQLGTPVQVAPGVFSFLDLTTAVSATFPVTNQVSVFNLPIAASATLLNTDLAFQVAVITPAGALEASNAVNLRFGY